LNQGLFMFVYVCGSIFYFFLDFFSSSSWCLW
jgi:hypothetical protein